MVGAAAEMNAAFNMVWFFFPILSTSDNHRDDGTTLMDVFLWVLGDCWFKESPALRMVQLGLLGITLCGLG